MACFSRRRISSLFFMSARHFSSKGNDCSSSFFRFIPLVNNSSFSCFSSSFFINSSPRNGAAAERNIYYNRHIQNASEEKIINLSSENTNGNFSSLLWMYGALFGVCISSLFEQNKKNKNVNCFPLGGKATEEVELGNVEDFSEDGETYDVKVHGGKSSVLVCKSEGVWYCTGATCPHYGAPLVKGVLSNDRLTCPWHDAQFDLKSGKVLHGPALSGIPTYPIREKNGKLVATLPKEIDDAAEPQYARRDSSDKRVYAIVGGGPAAAAAAETLRERGFTGRIVMICKEEHLPYDRIVLSKNFSASMEKIKLRDEKFYKNLDIEIKNKTEVCKVNTKQKTIHLDDGNTIQYDKVLIATGSSPRRLNVPGNSLKNIFLLRNFDDSKQIDEFAKKGCRVVVIGSSFIGMEVASTLAKKGATVTIISKEGVPYENTLGVKVGNVFKRLLKEKDVKFFTNKDVKAFAGNRNGAVNGVELTDGDIIQADAVVMGVGVALNTNILEGISLNQNDRSIPVDPFLRSVENEDVYAAGDVASFPYVLSGEEARIEHWVVAMQQGRTAAMNMCNHSHHPYNHVPFFWTMVLGKNLRYGGYCRSFDEVICEGDLANYKFVAYYVKNNKIVAVATMDNDPVCVAACAALRMNKMPSPSEITLGIANSSSIIKAVKETSFATPKKA